MRFADGSLHAFTATFYAALGLTPLVGCGGTVARHDDNDAGAGAHAGASVGGRTSSGGATSSGGRAGDGGRISSGGDSPGTGGVVGYGGLTAAGGITGAGGATGSGGVAGTGGVVGTGGIGGGTFIPCLRQAMMPGGYSSCADGTIHRPAKMTCPTSIPRPDMLPEAGTTPNSSCVRDTDCTDSPHGYCTRGGLGQIPGNFCEYGCTKDSECGADSICVCGEPVGHCAHADCTEDADCAGGLCAKYDSSPGCSGEAYSCQNTADACLGDGDCPAGQFCTVEQTTHARVCSTPRCAIGRPFLVEGAPRVAALRGRDDFRSELRPRVDELDEATRSVLVDYWVDIARMEHASVAAFARFALELMSLGAPQHLLVSTAEAMADELRHASDAFALASTYAGRDLGPGALDVAGSMLGRSPLDVVRTAILEGCIGETVAAVAAREALENATDRAVRAALTRVVPDETRHAELAWRFVQWTLRDGPVELRRSVARELVALVDGALAASVTAAESTGEDDVLTAHGVLSARAQAVLRARVLSDVVAPCARALVASVQRTEMPVAPGAMPSL